MLKTIYLRQFIRKEKCISHKNTTCFTNEDLLCKICNRNIACLIANKRIIRIKKLLNLKENEDIDVGGLIYEYANNKWVYTNKRI